MGREESTDVKTRYNHGQKEHRVCAWSGTKGDETSHRGPREGTCQTGVPPVQKDQQIQQLVLGKT